MNDALVYKSSDRYALNTTPIGGPALSIANNTKCNIVFHTPDGKEVGRMDFDSGELVFTGDAHTSAQVFIGWCSNMWSDKRAEDKSSALQEAVDVLLTESTGELYSDEEKIAILSCVHAVQDIKKKYVSKDKAYMQDIARTIQAQKAYATKGSV